MIVPSPSTALPLIWPRLDDHYACDVGVAVDEPVVGRWPRTRGSHKVFLLYALTGVASEILFVKKPSRRRSTRISWTTSGGVSCD